MKAKTEKTNALPIPLPSGITTLDITRPEYGKKADEYVENWDDRYFEIWAVSMAGEKLEWFIPTLSIAKARRGTNYAARTYATRIADGKGGYRIGRGPHVKACVTVYVRKRRYEDLRKYLDMRSAGAETANQIRDRISSRRAQGALERAAGRSYWRWNV